MSHTVKLTPLSSIAYGVDGIPVICNLFIARSANCLPDSVDLTIEKIGEDEPRFTSDDKNTVHIADFELIAWNAVVIHGSSSPIMVYNALVAYFGLALYNHYRATIKILEP